MKRTSLLAFLFASTVSFSQQFNGFGKLKIGISENEFIQNIVPEISKNIEEVNDKNLSKKKDEWFKYALNEKEPQRVYSFKHKYEGLLSFPIVLYASKTEESVQLSDSFKVYYLPKYMLGEIKLEKIFLLFYRDRLQLIELDNNIPLAKAAVEKYPPTVKLDTTYKVNCTYLVSGVKEEKIVMKNISSWITPDFNTDSYSVLDYNDKCKTVIVSFMRFASKEFINHFNYLKERKALQKDDKEKDKLKSIKDKI